MNAFFQPSAACYKYFDMAFLNPQHVGYALGKSMHPHHEASGVLHDMFFGCWLLVQGKAPACTWHVLLVQTGLRSEKT